MLIAEITGIGWVTTASMGCGKDHDQFAMTCGPLPRIAAAAVFDPPYHAFRRLDEYSRLGLAAIAFALKDAGLDKWTEKRNIGIIAATANGCLHTDIEYYDSVIDQGAMGASPALFSYTLPNIFLGEAAIRFGLTGISFVISAQSPFSRSCLQLALTHIACAATEKIICGYCDVGCPHSLCECKNVACGALFFVIEKRPARKALTYGQLRLKRSGNVLFNRCEIADLGWLAQKCVEVKQTRRKGARPPAKPCQRCRKPP
jgi:3-oxoacyl-[acyl-carrier-protein] synthase II